MKVSAKNLPIYLMKPDPVPVATVPTAITNANPAVVTVASTAGLANGDLAIPHDTGVPLLDGEHFIVGNVTATGYELIGADLSSLAAPPAMPGGGEGIDVYPRGSTMVRLCLANLEVAAPSVGTIDVGTYCADGSLPGPLTLGDVTFTGYLDVDDPTYTDLHQAAKDGGEREIVIEIPGNNGYITGIVALSPIAWTFDRAGAVGFTCTGTQAKAFDHVY